MSCGLRPYDERHTIARLSRKALGSEPFQCRWTVTWEAPWRVVMGKVCHDLGIGATHIFA